MSRNIRTTMMKESYYIQPPVGLERMILECIQTREKRAEHRAVLIHFSFLGSLSAFSFVGIIAALMNLVQGFTQSGFYGYVSLAFSDVTVVTTYWKELLFSLAESLPVIGLALFLLASIVFLWSASRTVQDVRTKYLLWI